MTVLIFYFIESFRNAPVCGGTYLRPLHKLNPVNSVC